MATEKQIAANRANALKSTGAKTITGRQKSSRNNTRHGLFKRSPFPDFESCTNYNHTLSAITAHLMPQNPAECRLVRLMALASWRKQQLWITEKTTLENSGKLRPRFFDMLSRLEGRYQRQYLKAWQLLVRIRGGQPG